MAFKYDLIKLKKKISNNLTYGYILTSVDLYFLRQLSIMPRREEATGASTQARQRRWWHLRQRWRMLGVFEIDQNHEFYYLTSMIKQGMRASIETTMDAANQVEFPDNPSSH